MRGEYLKQKHLWEQQMTCMELAKNKVKKNSTPGHKIKGKATPRVWAKMRRNSHTKVNIIITHAAYQPLLDPKLWSIKWLNCIISSVQPVYPLRMQFYTKLSRLSDRLSTCFVAGWAIEKIIQIQEPRCKMDNDQRPTGSLKCLYICLSSSANHSPGRHATMVHWSLLIWRVFQIFTEPWCTCTRQGKIPICYILKGIAKAKQHTEIKQPRYQNMLQLSWPPKKQAQNKL